MSGIDERASDFEREQTVARLREASAQGRLTLEELADRTASAYRARTNGELEGLTTDLPEAVSLPAKGRRTRWLVSAFVPLSRSGRQGLGERNVVVSLLAPVSLDLREAHVPDGEAEITVVALLAPVRITVPEHVEVDSSVLPLLAPAHEDVGGDFPQHAPRLRIRGVSVLAPVLVHSRRR